ncbi:MAG TPA: hypothetical protein VIT83_01985, partial [Gammaproteobacteria bacterium]
MTKAEAREPDAAHLDFLDRPNANRIAARTRYRHVYSFGQAVILSNRTSRSRDGHSIHRSTHQR